ncbi:Vacuolar protein sorting-associated protein 27 [Phytophthora citrophthora]|uniref:Vacuolar protein sorting-associated protein 27 n=1 Tax=Phytophthora citrophthora TaxID=4793 RepID=A0AAD9GU46_9STRA|nr:Vacuolar protein sorting-associated protein 27 [Phytophthora citrophthora]
MDGDFLHAINGDWDSLLTVMRENRQVAHRTDASGMTVLHWVCLHQDAPTDIVVKVVFANPYAVHMRNDAGHLPIDLAVQAECGERILEVLRAAAHGSRHPEDDGGELHQHDLMGKDDGEPATETIDYQLPYNNHTILHDDDIRDGSDYQPHQNHTYYSEDDDVDEDELEYQQHHRHYQPQPFQQQPPRKGRLERSVSDDSFYDPPQGNYGAGMYSSFGVGPDRDLGNTLSRSDPHVKSLLTEQRLRERENDLISIATADDSMPLGLFDPSKGAPDMSMMSGFQINEDVKSSHGNVNMSSRSMGVGPRSKTAFPPRWKQSRMCHVCACGFSLVKRRHHCRNCGQSVCNQHSTNRVSLPKFALSEPQRVCDQCFLSGHHIMVPGGQTGTPSIASSYQSLPAQLQREQLQHPFQTSQQYQMQFQHAR